MARHIFLGCLPVATQRDRTSPCEKHAKPAPNRPNPYPDKKPRFKRMFSTQRRKCHTTSHLDMEAVHQSYSGAVSPLAEAEPAHADCDSQLKFWKDAKKRGEKRAQLDRTAEKKRLADIEKAKRKEEKKAAREVQKAARLAYTQTPQYAEDRNHEMLQQSTLLMFLTTNVHNEIDGLVGGDNE